MHRLLVNLLIVFTFLILLLGWFNLLGTGPIEKNMKWGVTFSIPQAEYLNLDWRDVYISLLDDLKVKNFRLIAAWDEIEPENNQFDFSSIDWQLDELKKRDGSAILALGIKVPRWPECHIPEWAKSLSKEEQQNEIIEYIGESVQHFAAFQEVAAWQIENEPFFQFGQCPWHIDEDFLSREIAKVKLLDQRPVIVTGSGEWTTLFREARLGDIVGTTLYQKVYFGPFNIFFGYPFSSASYARKAWLIKQIFGKDVIDVELQTEPWSDSGLLGATKEENDKTFTIENFRENTEFASRAGHKEAYLWGAEWWYYMKGAGYPEYWEEARKIFTK